MTDWVFHVEGDQAEATAAALQALLRDRFAQAPQWLSTPPPALPEKSVETWIGVATVILMLPNAIEATLNIAERLRLKETLSHLQGFAQRQRADAQSRIWVRRQDRVEPLPLDDAALSELMEALQD
jgi:hypothetical protein